MGKNHKYGVILFATLFKIKRKVILTILFSFLIFMISIGQDFLPPAYLIKSDTALSVALPDSNWQSMPDPHGEFTLQQAISTSLFHNNDRKLNYRVHVYWVRYRISNTMQKEVNIALPETAAHADLYTKTNDGIWVHSQTGTEVRWSLRDGLKRIPAFTLLIRPGDQVAIYKRMYWDYIDAQPDSLKAYLGFADKLIQHNYIEGDSRDMTAIQDAFLLGMFILSIVINFYFFLVVREREFLLFSLFVLCSCFTALSSLNDVFLREYPRLLLYLYIFSSSFSGFILIHYIRYFFKTFNRFPRWDKYLVLVSFLYTIVSLAAYFASSALHTNFSGVSHFSENLIKLVYGASVLITLFMYVRRTDRMFKLMVTAFAPIFCLHVVTYALAIAFNLYYPRYGAPDVSGYVSSFNKAAFFIMIVLYLWMMIFSTWVLFLRFSQVKKELAQQSELDHLKSRFFANISHEFRTPLTLILGPIKSLLKEVENDEARQQLSVMENNAHHLLLLINQLLDLSKLESRQLKLSFIKGDILAEIKGITASFYSLGERNNIQLSIEATKAAEKKLSGGSFIFSPDAIAKIFNNLLSNAFKFTTSNGSVRVLIDVVENGGLAAKVNIQDSGPGIAPEHLPYIFDRFYQADNSNRRHFEGTGIGLSLTKELLEILGGSIEVKSSVAAGSSFTVIIPSAHATAATPGYVFPVIAKQAVSQASITEPLISPPLISAEEINEELPLILIVEDHAEVRWFIQSQLGKSFRYTQAANGKEGLEKAMELIPDIIICDVMMPQMDGFEFCAKVKTNDLTSHIPVILLSARAEEIDRLSGLQNGADDYLTKPFSPVELLTRVNNLLALREKLREKFSRAIISEPLEPEISERDRDFLQRLTIQIEENMIDPQFGVEPLSIGMHMSQSQLNRKLKAITNLSPVLFIRTIRMQRALKLLKQNKESIAAIAYEIGFDDPGYFTKVFKKHFGFLPSERKSFPK